MTMSSGEDVVTIDEDSRASNQQNHSVAIVDDEPIENDSQAESDDEDDEEFKSNKMARLDPNADTNAKEDDQEDNEVKSNRKKMLC